MIEKISVTNFKCHAHTEIELGRVTALVGPNGCGKTGLLQAVSSLCNLPTKNASQVFSGSMHPDVLVRGNGDSFSIEASINLSLGWKVEVELFAAENYAGKLRNWDIAVRGNWQTGPIGVSRSSLDSYQPISKHLPQELIREFGPVEYFRASPQKLSQPTQIEPTPAILSADGSGLASVIANLILSDSERHRVIEDELCKIVPTVKKVRARQSQVVEPEKVYSITERGMPASQTRNTSKPGYELIFDTLSANSIPAHAMSEGTLLVLAMLTLLYSPYPPVLFLIDDIEHGLHPLAQRAMMQIFLRFAETHKRQIVLTSHSPYIIDELDAKDVWVMATDKEGISHSKRLNDHPDALRLLEVLTTGELQGAVGEEWVLQNSQVLEEANA